MLRTTRRADEADWRMFLVVFLFLEGFGGWALIPERPIHRCDHFHRTVLNGDGIFMNFDQFFVFLLENSKCKNY